MIMVSTIDPVIWQQLIAAVIALISAIIALIKNHEVGEQREKVAEKTEIATAERTRRVHAEKELIDVKTAASNPVVVRAMKVAESNGIPGISEDEAGDFYRAIIADPETGPAQCAAAKAWLKRHGGKL